MQNFLSGSNNLRSTGGVPANFSLSALTVNDFETPQQQLPEPPLVPATACENDTLASIIRAASAQGSQQQGLGLTAPAQWQDAASALVNIGSPSDGAGLDYFALLLRKRQIEEEAMLRTEEQIRLRAALRNYLHPRTVPAPAPEASIQALSQALASPLPDVGRAPVSHPLLDSLLRLQAMGDIQDVPARAAKRRKSSQPDLMAAFPFTNEERNATFPLPALKGPGFECPRPNLKCFKAKWCSLTERYRDKPLKNSDEKGFVKELFLRSLQRGDRTFYPSRLQRTSECLKQQIDATTSECSE